MEESKKNTFGLELNSLISQALSNDNVNLEDVDLIRAELNEKIASFLNELSDSQKYQGAIKILDKLIDSEDETYEKEKKIKVDYENAKTEVASSYFYVHFALFIALLGIFLFLFSQLSFFSQIGYPFLITCGIYSVMRVFKKRKINKLRDNYEANKKRLEEEKKESLLQKLKDNNLEDLYKNGNFNKSAVLYYKIVGNRKSLDKSILELIFGQNLSLENWGINSLSSFYMAKKDKDIYQKLKERVSNMNKYIENEKKKVTVEGVEQTDEEKTARIKFSWDEWINKNELEYRNKSTKHLKSLILEKV